MNLTNLGVQELNAKEQISVVGGAWYSGFWPAAVATFLYNCVADWEENVAAFNQGREDLLCQE